MSKAPALDYAIEIIECFSKQNSPLSIADISNLTGINKNAISRILGSFLEHDWIYCCDEVQKKYLLTLRPFSLTSKCVSESSMVKIAQPILSRLNQSLGDSVYLGVKKEKTVLYLLHYDSLKPARISGHIGGEYPLHISAPGKILLANSDSKTIKNYFGNEDDKFFIEAEEIRKNGFALDKEEFSPGVICYAAPVFDVQGSVVASVGISTLTIYDNYETLLEKGKNVTEAAKSISSALGYDGLGF